MGIPIIRIIVFWGPCWGLPFWESPTFCFTLDEPGSLLNVRSTALHSSHELERGCSSNEAQALLCSPMGSVMAPYEPKSKLLKGGLYRGLYRGLL